MSNPKEAELYKKIQDLEYELGRLKKKKYGLVWEDKSEKFDKESQNALPVLKDKGGKFKDIITNPEDDFNILIEGDNYHSLSVLSYTHKGKIDVIYIDPPYNTGNKDFIYNDHFVDKDDPYRHSKWLSFMSKRLSLAKTVLSDYGLIFISIDDNEQSQLKLLCDQIFGEDNFIETILVEMSNTGGMKVGAAKEGKIAKNGEFVLVYSKSSAHYKEVEKTPLYDFVQGFDTHFNLYKTDDNKIKKLSEVLANNKDIVEELRHYGFESGKGSISLNKFSDYFDKSDVLQKFVYDNLDRIVRPRTEVPIIPDSIIANLKYNECIEYKSNKREESYFLTKDDKENIIQLVPIKYNYRKTDDFYSRYGRSVIRGDFWKGFWIDMGNISKEGDISFDNGKKPIRLIYQLLKWFVGKNKNATVLDFFAGSGTTGHATLELNKFDDGNRKFILCTNNENSICEKVTYERIKKAIKNYKNELTSRDYNLKYLKTDFVKIDKVNDNLRRKMVDNSTEVLCLKENTFNLYKDLYSKIKAKFFENKERYTAILFDTFYFEEFVDELNKLKDKPISIYVFSHTNTFPKEEFDGLNVDFTVEAIPEKILETYKKIFNF